MASSTVLSRSVLPLNCLTSMHEYARRSSTLRNSEISPKAFLRRSCGDCQALAQRSGQGRQTNFSILRLPGKLQKVSHLHVGGSRRGQNFAVRASGEPVTTEIPSEASPAASFKHILLPIIDSNPYLSSGTRAAASTATSLARAFGSDITVAVVDEGVFTGDKELRTKNIRWHLAEGGFENFALIEKEGQNPGAVIGEIADDMNLDLVILGMESIHSKQIDGNTLAEFVPCPVLLLP